MGLGVHQYADHVARTIDGSVAPTTIQRPGVGGSPRKAVRIDQVVVRARVGVRLLVTSADQGLVVGDYTPKDNFQHKSEFGLK